MNILSIAPTSFFNDYGCHVRILEEARALQSLGHHVTVLTYFKGNDVPGVRIIRTRPTPWRSNYEVGSSRHKFAFDVLLSLKLLQTLARQRFDVIHAHLHEGALIGSVLSRPWGVPVVFDYQGSLSDEMVQHRFLKAGTAAHRFFAWLERRIERLPDVIITSTYHAAEKLQSRIGEHLPVRPLPDILNTAVFHPQVLSPQERLAWRARFGIPPEATVAVFVGLLAAHQGVGDLIQAAARLRETHPSLRWLVIGYPGVELWRKLAAAHGVGEVIIFPGRAPYAELPKWLAVGDIAVVPKYSLSEGSHKTLIYMAMGLPTVAYDTPAQREILGPLGLYAPLGDVATFADRVVELVTNPTRRRVLSAQLRTVAERDHSRRRVAEELEAIYALAQTRRRIAPDAPVVRFAEKARRW